MSYDQVERPYRHRFIVTAAPEIQFQPRFVLNLPAAFFGVENTASVLRFVGHLPAGMQYPEVVDAEPVPVGRRAWSLPPVLENKDMCFFTSLAANAAAVAKRYGKQLDIVEAARQILAEQEREQRAKQEADPKHKICVYDIRLAKEIYVISAYAEPHCVIVSGSEELQVMQWGLIPRTAKPEDAMTAWPVRPKFNYGAPYDEGIIERVAEMQTPGL